MEINPMESVGDSSARDAAEASAAHSRLNTLVAITVALLATFMGVCKVKDDNLVQAMQQAQADRIDHWSFYQARNIRQEVAQAALDQLQLISAGSSVATQAKAAPLVAKYTAIIAD